MRVSIYLDSGKENGSYCSILGLYRDDGKEKQRGSGVSNALKVFVCVVIPQKQKFF